MMSWSSGPKGAPGMPEAGYLPIPNKLRPPGRKGHGAHIGCAHERHRVGTIVLHITPESADGGPLALVQQETRSDSTWLAAASIYSWTMRN